MSPLCESLLTAEQLNHMEPFYPLRVNVCPQCFLVQLRRVREPGRHLHRVRVFFVVLDVSWVEHARRLRRGHAPTALALTSDSFVVELASNDGYLLQHFVHAGIPVLGIEPAANVAEVARGKGVPTRVCFFGTESAARAGGGRRAGRPADRQQRAGAGSRPERFRRRDEDRARSRPV